MKCRQNLWPWLPLWMQSYLMTDVVRYKTGVCSSYGGREVTILGRPHSVPGVHRGPHARQDVLHPPPRLGAHRLAVCCTASPFRGEGVQQSKDTPSLCIPISESHREADSAMTA
ncbi:uncharacterized protein LOC135108065 [Scylla paramamosain]|uniref:uncharacterized protein LOC135108065 n=1 Tax=Scylla paramamosain TaxID=85552 RepID=UPI003083367F